MIGLVASVVVLMPMLAPLIGGVLDTLFGWESIFIFSAALSLTVFLWAVAALPETRRFSGAPGERGHFRADLAALTASPSLLRLRAVRGARLGAVLQLSRRRAARGGDHAGAHVGGIRPLVLHSLARIHGGQFRGVAARPCASASMR